MHPLFCISLNELRAGKARGSCCLPVVKADDSTICVCDAYGQRPARSLLFSLILVFVFAFASTSIVAAGKTSARAGENTSVKAGENIYRAGLVSSGEEIESVRETGIVTRGADAACVNCHRRSALGAKEGRGAIPPVAGPYLYQPRAKEGKDIGLPFVDGMRGDREPYTDATLARAIREGVDSEGKPLSFLMPHFKLNDEDMAALIAYLKSINQRRVPGVGDTVLHFATIITPDADPIKRRGMLDVLEHFFADRNVRQMGTAPPMRSSNTTAYSRSMNMIHRQWLLHVWELTGPESTWGEQLDKHYAKEPVFATISGLAGKSWAPVHTFCERKALPCIFPNVEAPPMEADRDFYTLYLNKGVLLEAELIASRIRESGNPVKVIQIYREGDIGDYAAAALSVALKKDGIVPTVKIIAREAPVESVAAAFQSGDTAIVLWLRPADIMALTNPPPETATIYLSGLMGGLERTPLPSEWRSRTQIPYGFDLPEKRRVRVDFALGWFNIRKIPIVAEQVQADTYLACGLLSETLKHMIDTFVQDYLVERVQDILEHRALTGYYPRLTMAPGQRFASKGGYMVHLSESMNRRVIADREWIVP